MSTKPITVNVAVASYEGSLFSWKGDYNVEKSTNNQNCELTMTSGFHCCQGSLRAIASSSSGRYLAIGGADERIRIFNMREGITLGELSTHTGAISCLDFFDDSYLLSGSEVSSSFEKYAGFLCMYQHSLFFTFFLNEQ